MFCCCCCPKKKAKAEPFVATPVDKKFFEFETKKGVEIEVQTEEFYNSIEELDAVPEPEAAEEPATAEEGKEEEQPVRDETAWGVLLKELVKRQSSRESQYDHKLLDRLDSVGRLGPTPTVYKVYEEQEEDSGGSCSHSLASDSDRKNSSLPASPASGVKAAGTVVEDSSNSEGIEVSLRDTDNVSSVNTDKSAPNETEILNIDNQRSENSMLTGSCDSSINEVGDLRLNSSVESVSSVTVRQPTNPGTDAAQTEASKSDGADGKAVTVGQSSAASAEAVQTQTALSDSVCVEAAAVTADGRSAHGSSASLSTVRDGSEPGDTDSRDTSISLKYEKASDSGRGSFDVDFIPVAPKRKKKSKKLEIN